MTRSRRAPARPRDADRRPDPAAGAVRASLRSAPAGDRTPPQGERPPEGSFWPYVVFIYRLPTPAETARMSVRRHLRRLGALSLQQGVYILPRSAASAATLTRVARHVADAGGTVQAKEAHVLPLRSLPPDEEAKIAAGFSSPSTRQDEDISADCPSSIRDTARRAEAVVSSAHKGSPWASVAQRGGNAGRMEACKDVSVGAAP